MILYLCVDNILIFEISLKIIFEIKQFLSNHFDMKDLGKTEITLEITTEKIVFTNDY